MEEWENQRDEFQWKPRYHMEWMTGWRNFRLARDMVRGDICEFLDVTNGLVFLKRNLMEPLGKLEAKIAENDQYLLLHFESI